ncbi:hypothetical protein V5N11_014187 [Cardamine amara subsp. amara]|uniref:Uncharacterized protein n=1 Tax=Cardamine amara subsp. amara TaxID=228776 RepID=A0ABD0Z8V2_CARAN
MEKVVEDEKKTNEEAGNSTEERMSDKEDERIRGDLVDSKEEGSMSSSNSHRLGLEDPDLNESDMEGEEKVLEFFRRNSGLIPEVTERNSFTYLNKSEEMVLEFQEDTPAETEQTNVVFHSLIDIDSNEISDLGRVNLNSPELLEGIKSSSASNDDDTEDSSSNSDLDSSLSRYYFDGSLPVSTHVEESAGPRDENQMPLLCLKQPLLQPTSWRNCCGILELLWAADP